MNRLFPEEEMGEIILPRRPELINMEKMMIVRAQEEANILNNVVSPEEEAERKKNENERNSLIELV